MNILTKILCGLSAALLLLLTILIFAGKNVKPVGTTTLATAAYFVFALALALILRYAFRKSDGRVPPVRAVLGVSIAYFGLLCVIASFMRYVPIWDFDAVYTGAINWGVHGDITFASTSTFDAANYFYWFPNNLGCTGFLALYFRICAFFGVKDFMLAGFVFCSALCAVSLAATTLSAYELGSIYSEKPQAGRTAAIAGMVLYLLTPPMLFCAHAVYTDFLSMPFGILSAYLLFKAVNVYEGRCVPKRRAGQETSGAQAEGKGAFRFLKFPCGRRTAILLAASAVSACIGVQLKATIGIAFIAGAMCLTLCKHWKLLLSYLVYGGGTLTVFMLVLNTAIYPKQLDEAKAAEMNTPTLHWIMMGLDGSGYYTSQAYEFTRSFSDTEERDAAIKAHIKDRLKELGAVGLAKHAFTKLSRMFSSATSSVGNFMPKPEPSDKTSVKRLIYDFVNPSGKNFKIYKFASCGARLCAMVLFAAFGIALIVRRKTHPICLEPLLCMVGIMLFLSFWEANDRYVINMLPFLILAAGCGAERLGAGIQNLAGRIKNAHKRAGRAAE